MPTLTGKNTTLSGRAKAAIESLGSVLLRQHPDPAAIDVSRFVFELRAVLQRVFILDRVGRLNTLLTETDPWLALIELDLELELFHGDQFGSGLGSDRIWSSDWADLVRREFGSQGGKWFGEVVQIVRGDADRMGAVDESLMGWSARIVEGGLELYSEAASDRRAGGVYYTPASLVGYVLDRALEPAIEECGEDVDRLLGLRVCDPACGCGYFLIEAAVRIRDQIHHIDGSDRMGDVVRGCLSGGDVNPMTAEICRWMVWLSASDESVSIDDLRTHILCGDSLVEPELFDGGFDVVVGNPPFLNQLGSDTARTQSRVAILRKRGLVGSATYTDEASAFLVLGLQLTKDGGRVCMVQPQSVIATRGGAFARERCAEAGWLESLWVSNEHVFEDASVYTCAPCVVVGVDGDRVERFSSGEFDRFADYRLSSDELSSLETWSSIAAVTMGVPEVEVRSSGVVGDVARATADFRDEYYGLEGKISDVPDSGTGGGVKLLTTGLVDLGRCWWGEKATRILKQRWESPRVNRSAIEGDERLAKWVASRSVQKVVVATQTKVVESFVDSDGNGGGEYAVVTPMISVMVKDEDTACRTRSSRGTHDFVRPDCAEDGESGNPVKIDVWMLGAAIGSPVCSMHAMRYFGGAAMHADALKMSARQVLGLPLPSDCDAWGEGAAEFERLHGSSTDSAYEDGLRIFGAIMCGAYGVAGDEKAVLMRWWLGRLGVVRGGG